MTKDPRFLLIIRLSSASWRSGGVSDLKKNERVRISTGIAHACMHRYTFMFWQFARKPDFFILSPGLRRVGTADRDVVSAELVL